jgi:hypothetical protein
VAFRGKHSASDKENAIEKNGKNSPNTEKRNNKYKNLNLSMIV